MSVYVAREAKAMARLRAKGHRDWADATDEQIQASAAALGRIYEHIFMKESAA